MTTSKLMGKSNLNGYDAKMFSLLAITWGYTINTGKANRIMPDSARFSNVFPVDLPKKPSLKSDFLRNLPLVCNHGDEPSGAPEMGPSPVLTKPQQCEEAKRSRVAALS